MLPTSRCCLFLLPHHFLHLGLFQSTQPAPSLSCFSSWSVSCLVQELLFITLDILVDVSDSPTDTPLEGSVVSPAVPPDHLNKEPPHLGPVRTGQGTSVSTLTHMEALPLCAAPSRCAARPPAPGCGAACVGRQKLSCAVASLAGSVGSILPEPGQMWPNLASGICPGPQTSSLTAPAWPTRPGNSVQHPGVGGWEPGPATSPAGLGSFPASSHMTPVSVYFCLWPPCLQRPRATSSLICFTRRSPCAGPFPVASFQSVCCLWLALPARTPHPTPSALYRCERGSGYFFM